MPLAHPAPVSLAAALALMIVVAPPASAQTASPEPANPAAAKTAPARTTALSLSAIFSQGGETVRSGIRWVVFRADAADLPVAAESEEAQPTLRLAPGRYIIEACYGLATANAKLTVSDHPLSQRLVLNAGAIKIEASVLDKPVAANRLTSRILAVMPSGDRRQVADDVSAEHILRLPEGRYFVESTFGDLNAVVSAEIGVHAGKLTDATFHHRAASMTLKLVGQPGGEAMANTSWSVMTPGGDVIRESIGAFPSMVLAEGNYTVVARHDGRVYQRDFEVKAGLDQDVEVLAR